MYHVTLANLTADARTIDILAEIEKRDVSEDELRALLLNFIELDPVANADVDAEVRVRVRRESYRLRTAQKKLVLSNVLERDQPGQVMTVDEAMDEMHGSAASEPVDPVIESRVQAVPVASAAEAEDDTYVSPLQPFDYGNRVDMTPVAAPPPVPRNWRLTIALASVMGLLLAAEIFFAWPPDKGHSPDGFIALDSTDAATAQTPLTGVYLTGSEAGQHGIVVGGPGELKLFELAAVEAPRVVNASYRLGRVDNKLWFATDQPGGGIEVAADGSLVYCGETYRRIP